MKTIISQTLGVLTQAQQLENWWVSESIEIPFFDNQKLPITFIQSETNNNIANDQNWLSDWENALQNFLKLTKVDRIVISHFAFDNAREFVEDVNDEYLNNWFMNITNEKLIWDYIKFTGVYVERRAFGDEDIYVTIACECEWEQEHGLQFVFKQGKKVVRVSEQDGHLTDADAWGLDDSEDDLLAEFEIN